MNMNDVVRIIRRNKIRRKTENKMNQLTNAMCSISPIERLADALVGGNVVLVRQIDAIRVPRAVVLPGRTLVRRIALRQGRCSWKIQNWTIITFA